MKKFLYSLILSLFFVQAHGQYLQVTHLAGTAVYGGVTVSLSTSGSTGTGGGDCLVTPVPYRTGGAPGGVPGTRTFVCSAPIYSIRLYCERIHETEFVRIYINGVVYLVTAANMQSYTDCYGLYFTSIIGGDIYGPPDNEHSAGILTITNCSGIDSFGVYCNGNFGGSTFYAWIDPTRCVTATSNAPICVNDTLKLFGNGGDTTATYTWYGPGGYTATGRNQSIPNSTVAMAGTYTVVQSGGRSKDTGTTTVTINPYPVVTAGSNSPVCPGSTISLTSGPAAIGETFSWTGPGSYTAAIQNPTINPAAISDTGNYTVIATLNGCSDTATTYVSITNIARPADSSNAPLCIGDTLRLFATDAVSGVTWAWSGPGGYASVLQSPVINNVTGANSGIYTVTATISGCSLSDTILITVNPIPIIPAILPHVRVCSGVTLTLQLDPTTIDGTATYYWSGPNGYTYTGLTPVITNIITAASGLYSVFASAGGCSTTQTYNNFVVDSTPELPWAANNGPLCSDSLLQFTSGSNTAGVSYGWTGPASYIAGVQNPSIPNAQTSQSGNYTVTVTLGLCANSAVTNVLINQTPVNPIVGSNGPVCAGALLNLSASFTPYTGVFHWSGPNSFTSLFQNPSILNVTMADSGLYTVYELINGCTSDTVSFNVVILPTPAVPVGTSNAPVCENGTLLLYATDITPGVSYNWAGPNTFSSTDQNTQITPVTPAASGLYTLTAILGTCSSTSIVNVAITGAPPILATSNSPVCSGDSLKLNAVSDPGNTFSWSGPYISTSLSGPSPVRVPAIMEYGGVYIVTTTGPGGCTSVAYDTVIIKPTPLAPWVTWLTFCQFDYAPPLMANDAANVLWFSSAAGGTGTTTPPIPSTSVPGVYFFYLNQTVNGCVSPIDSIQVIVNPKPVVAVAPVDTTICPRDLIPYRASSTDPVATFHWYPSSFLSNALIANPVAKPVASSTYSVVVTNLYNCTDTAFANVIVSPAALITLEVGDSVSLYPGEAFHITPITNCLTFAWFPTEGLSRIDISDPTASPDINTRYIVTGLTEQGCKTSDSIYFHVNDETIYAVPNAFTPGNGLNSTFKILEKGVARLSYFRVFNRWGQMIFETTNISEGWDGTYKGEPQPFGVYVYDIKATSLITGKVISKHGNVSLLR